MTRQAAILRRMTRQAAILLEVTDLQTELGAIGPAMGMIPTPVGKTATCPGVTTRGMVRDREMEKYLKLWPIALMAATLIGTGYVTLERQSALAEEIKATKEEIKELEDLANKLRENDIRTEGQLKLEVQKLNSNIAAQSSKIDQLLMILQNDRRP